MPLPGTLSVPFGPAHGPWTARKGARHSDAALRSSTSCTASECRAPVHGESAWNLNSP